MSQISLKPDWSQPAPEFPMFAQEAALKAFAQAYALWGDPRFKAAGSKVARFLTGTMAAPDAVRAIDTRETRLLTSITVAPPHLASTESIPARTGCG